MNLSPSQPFVKVSAATAASDAPRLAWVAIESALDSFLAHQQLADCAGEQMPDDKLQVAPGEHTNSIAVHIGPAALRELLVLLRVG